MTPKTLLERNEGILARLKTLKVLEPKLREIFVRGKREQLLQGVDATGRRFAPIKPATAKHRRGTGPPLSPQFASSELIATYRVEFSYREASVVVQAGWPMDWVRYHIKGSPRMERRDPSGFRRQDVDEGMRITREYIFNG